MAEPPPPPPPNRNLPPPPGPTPPSAPSPAYPPAPPAPHGYPTPPTQPPAPGYGPPPTTPPGYPGAPAGYPGGPPASGAPGYPGAPPPPGGPTFPAAPHGAMGYPPGPGYPGAPPGGGGRRRGLVWLAIGLVLVLFAAGTLLVLAARGNDAKVTFTPGDERNTGQGYDRDLQVLLDDIESFWAKEYPKLFRGPLEPLAGGVIAARPGVSIPRCGSDIASYNDVEGNAFYCRLTDYIAYDDAALFPELDKRYGVVALAIVLAHEWGHAIQQRAGFDAAPVIFELQADCYAGAWLAHADSTFSSLGDDEKVNAMIAMLSFSDPVGTLSNEEGAHGSAFDRVSAFTDGLRNSTRTCAAYDNDRPTFQLPFRSAAELESGGNLPFDELVASLSEVLNVTIEPATRACPVKRGEYIVWCRSTQGLVYSDEAEELSSGIGDFAVGYLVLLGVAEGDGAKDPYCEVGAQSSLLLEGTDGVELSLSPGDLDEAVIALLFTSQDKFWDIVDHIDRLGHGLTTGNC